MDYSRTKGTTRRLDEVPWFGSAESLCNLLNSVDKFTVDMRERSITHEGLSLQDVQNHASCRVKEMTVEGVVSAEDQHLGTIKLVLDKNGFSALVSSNNTDWVDSTIACLQRDARKSQSRWFAHKSVAVRRVCAAMGIIDAAVVGSLVSSSIRDLVDTTPQILVGMASFLTMALLFVIGALRGRLFEIVTEYQQALYVYLPRLLVGGLFFGVITEVLVNFAT
jgi:hypothetical protein